MDPDPSKAVNLCVTFDSKAPCVVGELLPGKRSQDAKSLACLSWLTIGNPRDQPKKSRAESLLAKIYK